MAAPFAGSSQTILHEDASPGEMYKKIMGNIWKLTSDFNSCIKFELFKSISSALTFVLLDIYYCVCCKE